MKLSNRIPLEEIDRVLSSDDVALRRLIARTPQTFSATQIEKGLMDVDPHVRRHFASRTDFKPTPEQIERGLTDSHCKVILAFLERKDFCLSLSQFDRAMASHPTDILLKTLERHEYELTEEQKQKCLTSRDHRVRHFAFSHLKDLTDEQIKNGLSDKKWFIRHATLTTNQNRISLAQKLHLLTDKDWQIRAAVLYNSKESLCLSENQILTLLQDPEPQVRGQALSHIGTPTSEMVAIGLKDPYEAVRHFFVHHPEVILTPEQIEHGLLDNKRKIRLTVAERTPEWLSKREKQALQRQFPTSPLKPIKKTL